MQQKHKHLGIYIDNKLTFNDYTQYVYNSCIRKWTTIRRICPFTSPTILTRLYKVYILPLIEYSFFTWVPSEQQFNKIESIQKQVTKYICFKAKMLNLCYIERLVKLDLKSLRVRRDLKILKYVLKSIYNSNDVPLMWKNMFVLKDSRNGFFLEKINTRIQLCDKNFFIYSIN